MACLELSKSSIVGFLGFDLSAAFDTVSAEQLLPKLERIGISGAELRRFADYLAGGKQYVQWNDACSGLMNLLYGVRQGSILGPLLFLILVANAAEVLGGNNGNVTYADDTSAWVSASTLHEVKAMLETKSADFAQYAMANGPALNSQKTQLLVGGKGVGAGDLVNFSITVDGKTVLPASTFKLLGVKFDSKFSTAPHDPMMMLWRPRLGSALRMLRGLLTSSQSALSSRSWLMASLWDTCPEIGFVARVHILQPSGSRRLTCAGRCGGT
jgi:hypothetical protein